MSPLVIAVLLGVLTCIHAKAQEDLPEGVRGVFHVSHEGQRLPTKTKWHLQFSGFMQHAVHPSESVDAGKVLIAHVEAEPRGGSGRELYRGSLATDSDSKGSWVPINVEGNVAEGIIGFADSVFCPSSIHMSGLAVDSALRVLTCSRSTGLTLTWNPDTHTDSVEIMIAELCDPYSTVENDYAAEPVVIRTSDDGNHVITSADLNTFAPSVERVVLHISRSIQRVVAHGSQRVLLVGKAHTRALLRLDE